MSTQHLLGDPAGLVPLQAMGATTVTPVVLRYDLTLTARRPQPHLWPAPAGCEGSAAAAPVPVPGG